MAKDGTDPLALTDGSEAGSSRPGSKGSALSVSSSRPGSSRPGSKGSVGAAARSRPNTRDEAIKAARRRARGQTGVLTKKQSTELATVTDEANAARGAAVDAAALAVAAAEEAQVRRKAADRALATVEKILSYGADVLAQNNDGDQAAHIAARMGHIPSMEVRA